MMDLPSSSSHMITVTLTPPACCVYSKRNTQKKKGRKIRRERDLEGTLPSRSLSLLIFLPFFFCCFFICLLYFYSGGSMLGTQPLVVILKVGCWLLVAGCWLLVVVCCCLLFCCVNLLNQLYYNFGGGRKVFNTSQLCFVLSFLFLFFFFFLVELFLGCCVLSVSVLNHCGTTATFFPLTPLFSYFYISIPCISYSSSC